MKEAIDLLEKSLQLEPKEEEGKFKKLEKEEAQLSDIEIESLYLSQAFLGLANDFFLKKRYHLALKYYKRSWPSSWSVNKETQRNYLLCKRKVEESEQEKRDRVEQKQKATMQKMKQELEESNQLLLVTKAARTAQLTQIRKLLEDTLFQLKSQSRILDPPVHKFVFFSFLARLWALCDDSTNFDVCLQQTLLQIEETFTTDTLPQFFNKFFVDSFIFPKLPHLKAVTKLKNIWTQELTTSQRKIQKVQTFLACSVEELKKFESLENKFVQQSAQHVVDSARVFLLSDWFCFLFLDPRRKEDDLLCLDTSCAFSPIESKSTEEEKLPDRPSSPWWIFVFRIAKLMFVQTEGWVHKIIEWKKTLQNILKTDRSTLLCYCFLLLAYFDNLNYEQILEKKIQNEELERGVHQHHYYHHQGLWDTLNLEFNIYVGKIKKSKPRHATPPPKEEQQIKARIE